MANETPDMLNGPASMYTFREFVIPRHMMEALIDYIDNGNMPGHFLTAVLENNLQKACAHADELNLRNLPAYAAYLYNEAPASCFGSPEAVTAWVKERQKANG